jgi:hypothetical protein
LIDAVKELSWRLRYNVTFTPLIGAEASNETESNINETESSKDVSIVRARASTMRSVPSEMKKTAWPLPIDVVLSSSFYHRRKEASGAKIDQSNYVCTKR